MIKFMLAARKRPDDTQENYFYNWGIIHVALMLTTPAVMKVFKRYDQHYTINGINSDKLIHPLSEMAWDNFADHWIEKEDDFDIILYHPDYVIRMQPHRFGDYNFIVEVTEENFVHQRPDFASGGVKLVHFLKKQPHLSHAEFAEVWRDKHAPVVLEAANGLLRKYMQSSHLPLDPKRLKGTLFEMGGVGQFSGVEEFWFDSLADLYQFCEQSRAAIAASEANFVEAAGSISMVTAERVIYDFTLPEGQRSPLPAVLAEGSLETAVYNQGLRDWNKVDGGD